MKQDSPLKPVKEFRTHRRGLPHFEDPGGVYFITFRTTDGCRLSDTAKDLVASAIDFHANHKYALYAFVVMNTHVHCILQPLEQSEGTYYSLAGILHSIKSYSANRIQKELGWKGSVWQNENYDRVVREDKAFEAEMNYIIGNPIRDGIVDRPEDYRWLCCVGMDGLRTSRDARATEDK